MKLRDPWNCPACGRSLTVRNQEHVCGLYDLESHFFRKSLVARAAFDWMSEVFDTLGPYEILPMKTMIAFARGVNLAFLKTKRTGADVSVVLAIPPSSERVTGVVPYSRTKAIYRIPIKGEFDLDEELRSWLRAAYDASGRPG
jgi:hypothetical protein